jgi:hypothetical protein
MQIPEKIGMKIMRISNFRDNRQESTAGSLALKIYSPHEELTYRGHA